jgi:[ribosomal protein S18]-alanine N-acetyltransferase
MSAEPNRVPRNDWKVRAMRSRDLDAVAAIESAIYPFPWTRGNFDDSLKAGYDTWIFEHDGTMLGYAILMWVPDEIHLLNLSVQAAAQSRGLGRAILRWLCDNARERGARGIMLEVRPSNERALALYDSAGFKSIGVRKRYYPSFDNTREDALVFVKALTDE